MDIRKRLEHEREVRRVEREMAECLLRFDKATSQRIVGGLELVVEQMPDTPHGVVDTAKRVAEEAPLPPAMPPAAPAFNAAASHQPPAPVASGPGRPPPGGPGPGALTKAFALAQAIDAGPTNRITQVLRTASSRQMTANQILDALKALYPAIKHDYVQQVLSRSAKRGGPFGRARKDPETDMWLYFLRSEPPQGVNPSVTDEPSDQEDDV
ncbi:hypothetical protein [Sorangium sp. So ce426]|uniref:hypothetical protein n=1 Tax=Sorangium sp. So ce426 TaxID=3133312 RepID=UPI003F5AE5C1